MNSKLSHSCYVRATSLLNSRCVGGDPTDLDVRAGRGVCGVGQVPAMSTQIATQIIYVHTACPGRPLRHAGVKGQAAEEEGANGREKESCRKADPNA
jgi:hypothetical protein